jgi:hypothetical protein
MQFLLQRKNFTAIALCGVAAAAGLLISNLKESKASVRPPAEIDTTYPNNWRGPELTDASYKMQVGNEPCPPESENVQYIDPLSVILDYAKNNRLVMISESHYRPLHRLFISQIAQHLSGHGYHHYGAELIGPAAADALNSNRNSGENYIKNIGPIQNYLGDPVYAQVLETLSKKDYVFFSYETTTQDIPNGAQSQIDVRDGTQAKNIAKYYNDHPEAKILIHAGYHHIKEKIDGSRGYTWMAQKLNDDHGINPLTISQTHCTLDSYLDGAILGYSLLADASGKPISMGGYDMVISAPPSVYNKQRPTWLRGHMERQFIDVPRRLRFDGPKDYTVITAKHADRPDTAAPEDIIYRDPFSEKALALRPGRYNLIVTDREKNILATQNMTVEE